MNEFIQTIQLLKHCIFLKGMVYSRYK